jgi:hypothetical protein
MRGFSAAVRAFTPALRMPGAHRRFIVRSFAKQTSMTGCLLKLHGLWPLRT